MRAERSTLAVPSALRTRALCSTLATAGTPMAMMAAITARTARISTRVNPSRCFRIRLGDMWGDDNNRAPRTAPRSRHRPPRSWSGPAAALPHPVLEKGPATPERAGAAAGAAGAAPGLGDQPLQAEEGKDLHDRRASTVPSSATGGAAGGAGHEEAQGPRRACGRQARAARESARGEGLALRMRLPALPARTADQPLGNHPLPGRWRVIRGSRPRSLQAGRWRPGRRGCAAC